MKTDNYFQFRDLNCFFHYIGRPEEIMETVEHYKRREGFNKLIIPEQRDFIPINETVVQIVLPGWARSDYIDIPIHPEFRLCVNANAFDYVRKIAKDFQKFRRGGLYKIDTKTVPSVFLYLPGEFMQELHDFRWNEHIHDADESEARRIKDLSRLENDRKILRVFRL